MTVTWMDGFDLYTTTNDGTTKYTSWPNFDGFATGRLGVGQCVTWGGNTGIIFPNNGGSTTATLSIGVGYKSDNVVSADQLFSFRNAGSEICSLEITDTGAVQAKRGSTVLGTSAASLVVNSVWAYIEVEFERHASAGVFKAYVNGVQALNLTAQNTGASDIDSIRVGAGNATFYLDDLYVTDTSTKLGECRIDVLRPSADTATKDWAASTGVNNYACVDDTTFDTADYVSAASVGNKDYYNCSDLSFNPASIFAVQVTTMAKKDDATTRTYRGNIKSSSSEGNGATRGLSTSYNVYSDIFNTDPNGSIAWTQASVNAAQVGIEVVS